MALRLGAKEVSIAYRRSGDEMQAIKDFESVYIYAQQAVNFGE